MSSIEMSNISNDEGYAHLMHKNMVNWEYVTCNKVLHYVCVISVLSKSKWKVEKSKKKLIGDVLSFCYFDSHV